MINKLKKYFRILNNLILLKFIFIIFIISSLINGFTLKSDLIISLIFLIIFLDIRKYYLKRKDKIDNYFILKFIYLFIILDMFITGFMNNIELGLIGFIIGTIILYDFKIDPAFMAFPAILIFGYIFFLSFGKNNEIISIFAVYAFYFLISGIFLMVIDLMLERKIELYFEASFKKFLNKLINLNLLKFICIILSLISIIDLFINFEFFKLTLLYLLTLIIINFSFYFVKFYEL